MNLSDELFEQVVTSLAPGEVTTLPSITMAPPAPAGEQRRGRRVTAQGGAVARLIPLTDKLAPFPFDVRLRDLSPGGVGFLHASRVPLDEQFVLLLPTQDGDVAVLCAVAYWQPLAKEQFAIGARFTRVLRQGSTPSKAPPATRPAASIRKAV